MAGILESAMDAIISIGADQRVVLYNAAAEKIFQWPRAAVLGQPLNMLIPARYRTAHAGHVKHFGQTGMTSRPMGGQSARAAARPRCSGCAPTARNSRSKPRSRSTPRTAASCSP